MTTSVNKKIETVQGFEIWFEAEQEDISIKQVFIDECGFSPAEFKALKSSAWFSAKVEARKSGIVLATEYLGCCSYAKVKDFYTTYKDCYYSDMVAAVVDEATPALALKIKELQTQLELLQS